MEIIHWFTNHGESLLQSAGIIGGLVFTGISLRSEAKARRISNLIALTQQHRDIWKQLYEQPELARVLNPSVDLKTDPVRREERLLVRFLILYLGAVYKATEFDELLRPDGMQKDVREFFALPIPTAVWQELKKFQDENLVLFIERLQKKRSDWNSKV